MHEMSSKPDDENNDSEGSDVRGRCDINAYVDVASFQEIEAKHERIRILIREIDEENRKNN